MESIGYTGDRLHYLGINLWERKLFESELLVTEDVGAKSSIFDVDGEELRNSDIRSTNAEQYLIANELNDSLNCSGSNTELARCNYELPVRITYRDYLVYTTLDIIEDEKKLLMI